MRLLSLSGLMLCGVAFSCAGSGFGDAVRKDLSNQMLSSQPALSNCYQEALKRNRDIRGQIVIAIATEPKTGHFSKVSIAKNETGDKPLEECVVAEVSRLSLAEPPSTSVSTEYPLQFEPAN